MHSAKAAIRDIVTGIAARDVWTTLAWQEVRQRYRRSMLGPFWLTISTAALLAAMGPLYGRLLSRDIDTYFPYLAIGFVMWQFLSALTNEACFAFISAEGYIRNVKLPLTVHVMRVVWRNLIIFAHNLIIVAFVLVVLVEKVTWRVIEVPFAILAIVLNAIWVGLLLGLLCARFRDIPQIIASIVQVAFFLTPVLWQADMLGRNAWFAKINPYYHFVEIVRQPLLSTTHTYESWIWVGGTTVLGFLVTVVILSRFRSRVPYWI